MWGPWVAVRGADNPLVLPKTPMTADQPLPGLGTFPSCFFFSILVKVL